MPSRSTPRLWRRAFLRALARTANVEWSVAEAGVDKSTAYNSRKKDAAFAKSWERALAQGRARVSGVSTALDTNGKGDGKLRGDARLSTVRLSKVGRPCLMRTGEGRWNSKLEAHFLALLQATANVKASAAAVGFSTTALYQRRINDAVFAQAWAVAKQQGYERVEMGCIARASAAVEPFDWAAEAGIDIDALPEMSNAELLNILKLHRAACAGGKPQRYGWRKQPRPRAEIEAELLRKIELIKRGRPPA